MGMTITLSPETQARIQELVAEFAYPSPEAVVDEALRVLEEREKYVRLKAAIAVGLEQIERGEAIPWTPDLLDQLKREAEEDVRLGRHFDDDVIP